MESVRQPGDVVISAGSLYAALGGVGVPSSNTATLRLALYLRSTAIKQAREKQLSGFILTSNANRADLARLQAEAGGAVRILKMTEAQACARIAQIVPAGDQAVERATKESSGAGLAAIGRRLVILRLAHERRNPMRG